MEMRKATTMSTSTLIANTHMLDILMTTLTVLNLTLMQKNPHLLQLKTVIAFQIADVILKRRTDIPEPAQGTTTALKIFLYIQLHCATIFKRALAGKSRGQSPRSMQKARKRTR